MLRDSYHRMFGEFTHSGIMSDFAGNLFRAGHRRIPAHCPWTFNKSNPEATIYQRQAATLLHGSQYLKGTTDDQVRIYKMFCAMKGYWPLTLTGTLIALHTPRSQKYMPCGLLSELHKESSQFPPVSKDGSENCCRTGSSYVCPSLFFPCLSFESHWHTITQVHTLLTVWKNHGHNNSQPLHSNLVKAIYNKLLGSIEQVTKHPYYGPKLENTLAEWAQSGLCIFSAFYCIIAMLTFYWF
jgi:hypothetical protein